MNTVQVGQVRIGPDAPLAIIAGPCVAESYDLCLRIGSAVRDRCAKLGLGYIFKASFDKANRSSGGSYRGPGLDSGLALLEKVGKQLGVPVTTDVHEPSQAAAIAEAVDLLQVPAFLCRQTDLLVACAATGRPVNVKKGQFLSPAEMANVVEKIVGPTDRSREAAAVSSHGRKPVVGIAKNPLRPKGPTHTVSNPKPQPLNPKPDPAAQGGIILTERGTFFGYNRLVNDFVGLGDMLELGWPVCFDITHSTQQPGGQGMQSGGRPERAPLLARCAVAAGVQAIFLETHPDPAKAKSDAASMLPLERALVLLDEISRLCGAVR